MLKVLENIFTELYLVSGAARIAFVLPRSSSWKPCLMFRSNPAEQINPGNTCRKESLKLSLSDTYRSVADDNRWQTLAVCTHNTIQWWQNNEYASIGTIMKFNLVLSQPVGCWHIQLGAVTACWALSQPVSCCQSLLSTVRACWVLSKSAGCCHSLLSVVTVCWRCHSLLSNVAEWWKRICARLTLCETWDRPQ